MLLHWQILVFEKSFESLLQEGEQLQALFRDLQSPLTRKLIDLVAQRSPLAHDPSTEHRQPRKPAHDVQRQLPQCIAKYFASFWIDGL
jgi:hypothetical protein